MLQLNNLTKKYAIGTFRQTALDGVSIRFRTKEFVAILGPSGSGKTTMLNMIGGLDRYDGGDLLINGKTTRHFKDHEWDSYRNHAIGFVFQNYNLISHISVLANVEVGMTLSGLDSTARKVRALEVLDRVGLKDHVNKKPNQLSGGQMQRVAIARALANEADIILADEPTGAIDSETSKQIMTLIQEIAKDKLVIMVTHDETIAKTYANRIVKLRDGKIIEDSNPYASTEPSDAKLIFKKTSMAFLQAIKLSFTNLKTKKFRTLLTAFAGSIGIIGVALVLSLANGLNNEIKRLEMTTLAEFPIQIDPFPIDIDAARGGPTTNERGGDEWSAFPSDLLIFPYERTFSFSQHSNVVTEDYLAYLQTMNPRLYNEISISHQVNMNVLYQLEGDMVIELNTGRVGFEPSLNNSEFLESNYDVLAGRLAENQHELILVVDRFNRLEVSILSALGLSGEVESYDFETFIGETFKVVMLDDYYLYDEVLERFYPNPDLESLYDTLNAIDLTVTGIVRVKDDALSNFLRPGLKYHPDLVNTYLSSSADSEIGQAQRESQTSVITGLPLSTTARTSLLRSLGVDPTPSQIRIYPVDFEAKTEIRLFLDAYNTDLDEEDRIIYTDLASLVTELTGDVIDGIAYVLIAFSSISLIVSSVMIGIITYVSVLERTKEIGILRSLGARKRDISRVFNAETSMIGFVAGVLGVTAAFLLTFPINRIIQNRIPDINRLAVLPVLAVFALVAISVFLTYISSLIPAQLAARKDPVEALRVD